VSTAPPTFTPGALPVLHGHVVLQGRPFAPDPRWSTPLTLTLRLESNSSIDLDAISDERGYFTVTVATGPGNYTWRVKESHALATSGAFAVSSGYNDVEMGTLLEGDANNDNCVAAADMTLVSASFGSTVGAPNYNPNADFNGDSAITAGDFTLLRANFGFCGAAPLGPHQPEGGHRRGPPSPARRTN